MNELEKFLDKLQNADDGIKKMIMWLGVPFVMVLVVFVWLTTANFGYQEVTAAKNNSIDQKDFSRFEVFKKGLAATMQELKSVVKGAAEKINQTNSFNIENPQSENYNEINVASSGDLDNVQIISATTTITTN